MERGTLVAGVTCLMRVMLQAPLWLQEWGCSRERSCLLAMGQLSRQER